MKITLETPPDGFEAVAEWRIPKCGDKILLGNTVFTTTTYEVSYRDSFHIVLTRKKKKFWRLDTVGFEDATSVYDPAKEFLTNIRLSRDKHGNEAWYTPETLPKGGQWLRRTECEE